MSEALFLFTLLAATRRLAGCSSGGAPGIWWRRGLAGIGLRGAQRGGHGRPPRHHCGPARYLLTTAGTAHERRMSALTDGVVFAAPFALSFIGWAATSWVIVGHPFEQFSSVYGTSSQLKLILKAQHGRAALYSVHGALSAITAFAPLLVAILALAIARAAWDREPRILAVLAIVGGVLLFEIVAFALGLINVAERYFIYAIPLAVLSGVVARPAPRTAAEVREDGSSRRSGLRPATSMSGAVSGDCSRPWRAPVPCWLDPGHVHHLSRDVLHPDRAVRR